MSAQGDPVVRVNLLIADEPPGAGVAVGTVPSLQRLCRAAARALPATGVAVSLVTEEATPGMAAASDETSAIIDELQFTVGEGPCLDAFATRRPVLTANLADGGMTRWPGYAPAAHDQGVRAVFAFPLQIGAACLGVMDVYRDTPGALSREALAQALTFAEVAVSTLLDGQERAADGEPAMGLDEAMEFRSDLHQAQGMVMVQLGVSLAEAMVRLRAQAYAHNRRLAAVARDVITRRLDLTQDDQ